MNDPPISAYFEEAPEAVFGVVDREEFESHLRSHLEGNEIDDPAWYALRQCVYATGCRIVLSKDQSNSFSHNQKEAWSYFRNAISVHTELLFTFTGLMAVRALIVMVSFLDPTILSNCSCGTGALLT